MTLDKIIADYFMHLDESLDALSMHKEGELVGLPSWVHCTRRIIVGCTEDGEGVVIKITPDNSLEKDEITLVELKTNEDINHILEPMSYGGTALNRLNENDFTLFGDMRVVSNNPLDVPALDERLLVGFGRKKGFEIVFSIEKAKEEAIGFWNARALKHDDPKSYVSEVKNILDKFKAIIRKKSFLERRIHRFIIEHSHILLPPHKKCFYEHIVYRNEDFRKADFILEREQGLPPILIELESPTHPIFTKNYDLTAQANHARSQISEWVAFIDSDAMRNARGDFYFLTGPKERLVIIGRGLEHKSRLIETKYDGVVFWTYDILIEEITNRLNDNYASQCGMVGLALKRPF